MFRLPGPSCGNGSPRSAAWRFPGGHVRGRAPPLPDSAAAASPVIGYGPAAAAMPCAGADAWRGGARPSCGWPPRRYAGGRGYRPV